MNTTPAKRKSGGQPGNNNGARGTIWRDAVIRALERRSRIKQRAEIDALADTLLDMALDRDLGALKEIGDRLDGKPKQQVSVDGPEEGQGLIVRVVYGAEAPPIPIPIDGE